MKLYEIHFPNDEGVKYQMFRYPAGEAQVRILPGQIELLTEATEIRVTADIRNGDIMPLALLTDAIREINGGNAVHDVLIIPYLPYSRADRRFMVGDCLGLKVFGDMIDELGYSLVLTLDSHSSMAKRYISNLYGISPSPLIASVQDTIGDRFGIILLPDEGANRYQRKYVGTTLKCHKKRDSITGFLSGFEVPPVDAFGGATKALIVDDICDGGGTFLGIADAMKDHGIALYLYVTHGSLSKGLDELHKRFTRVFTSDSFGPREGVTVMSSKKLVEDAIEHVRKMQRAS